MENYATVEDIVKATKPQQPQIDKLAAALCKAQAVMKHPIKDNTAGGGSFSYSYADLPSVIDAIKAAFSKHGLSFMQLPAVDLATKIVTVKTIILHESGQMMESELQMGIADFKPQTIGSGITYARRYALSAMAGIAAETDDDGSSGSGKHNVSFQRSKK